MKHVFLVCLFLTGGLSLFGQNLTTAERLQVPSPDLQTLAQKGEVVVYADHWEDLHLWKALRFADPVQTLFHNRSGNMAVEALFWIPQGPGSAPPTPQKISQALTAVSTMKNLQVWSNSKQAMETFIYDTYRVGSLDKNNRLGDPVTDPPLSHISFNLFQNEEQTGESFAQYTLSHEGGWYQVSLTNLTDLKYGPITLVAPQGLLTCVFVVPSADGVLVYGISQAKTFEFFGLEKSKRESLYTRMRALVNWFKAGLKP